MYSWSASRKNILYRFVVYKREAPRYFSLARIYRDSFLLVCEGSYGNCIVLYDATKEIYEYTQRRRTETLERRRQKKKKKQAPVSHKDEAPASSSSSSSFKRERVGKEEKERKEEEEEEEEKKNVSGEWDAEELCDLDGDCGVCDDDGFDLPQPPVVTPDKKKPSYTLIGHVYTIVAVDTNRGDDLLLSLSGEDSKLLLWKFGFTSPLQTFDCRPATFYLGWSWHVVSDEDLVAFSCDHGVYVMQLSHRRRCLLQRSRLLSLTRRRGRRRTSSYAPDRHLSQNREDKTRKKKQEAYKKQPFSTASVSKKKKKRHFFLLSGRKTKREKSK
ncbi:hypothetical protein CSUI_004630 [Cystoisospora suis]|uniref:Uncharacterized protein n=1 Tax=Cystoisospora suis TaxID=483139 RepID=A0A2C6L0F6_9APIC|nr:hypothetical protein CSUI_004630 [Cystoisospora suis]